MDTPKITQEELDTTFRTLRQFINIYKDNVYFNDAEYVKKVIHQLDCILSLYESRKFNLLFEDTSFIIPLVVDIDYVQLAKSTLDCMENQLPI